VTQSKPMMKIKRYFAQKTWAEILKRIRKF